MKAFRPGGRRPAARASAHAHVPIERRDVLSCPLPPARRPDLIAVPAASWPAWTDIERWTVATEKGGADAS